MGIWAFKSSIFIFASFHAIYGLERTSKMTPPSWCWESNQSRLQQSDLPMWKRKTTPFVDHIEDQGSKNPGNVTQARCLKLYTYLLYIALYPPSLDQQSLRTNALRPVYGFLSTLLDVCLPFETNCNARHKNENKRIQHSDGKLWDRSAEIADRRRVCV